MKLKNLTIIILLTLINSFQAWTGNTNITQVYIISSLHKNHLKNTQYTYDTLYAKVAAIAPDILGIEIRPIDLITYSDSIAKFYPLEMHTLWKTYKEKIPIYGFDWMGDSIATHPLSVSFFEQLRAKILQLQLQEDTTMLAALSPLSIFKNAKTEIVLKSSFKEIHNGIFDSLNTLYYNTMAEIFKQRDYQELSDFYMQRDSAIATQIIQTIEKHKDKKLVFVMGGDHRSYTLQQLASYYSQEIQLGTIKIMPLK